MRRIFSIVSSVIFVLMALARQADAGVNGVPVPEPATAALLGVGAAAVGVVAWWRGRRK